MATLQNLRAFNPGFKSIQFSICTDFKKNKYLQTMVQILPLSLGQVAF